MLSYKVWNEVLFYSILFFTNCIDLKQYNQASDLPAKVDTNVLFKIKRTVFRIPNDTNDQLLSYFTFSNDIDCQKIFSITKNYYLNIADVKNCTASKVEIPEALKSILKSNLSMVQFCQGSNSVFYFLKKDTLVKWNLNNSDLFFQKVNLPVDFNTDRYYLSTNLVQNFGFPMYFKEDRLFFGSFLIDRRNKIWSLESENYPYEVCLPLNNLKPFTYKINFPDFVAENFYGLRFQINRLRIKDGNLISFPFSGNMYLKYNFNDSLKVIGGKSIYQSKNFISPLSLMPQKNKISNDSNWYYYTHNEYYSNFIFNSNTRQFFRLFYHDVPTKKKDGFYSTQKDRIISVQVFNEQFLLVHEEILNDINFVIEFMPYKDGFIINNNGIDFKKNYYEYLYYEVRLK